MKSGGLAWEPASANEAAYYDKLFGIVDRDKSGTVDGQEAVKFLSFSGLTKSQLKVRLMPYSIATLLSAPPVSG